MKIRYTAVIGMVVCFMMLATFAGATDIVSVPNGTVADGKLAWLQNADCFGRLNWNQAASKAANLKSGDCGLTDKSRAGDWRLPTNDELLRRKQNRQGFYNVNDGNYWTSSIFVDKHGYKYRYTVGMSGQNGGADDPSHYNRVWPVREFQLHYQ